MGKPILELPPGTDISRLKSRPVHAADALAVIAELGTERSFGLSQDEAASRLERYGRNEIQHGQTISIPVIILRQFASPVVWLLIAAAVAAIFFGELTDAVAIAVVLLLNAGIGFVTEYNARKSMDAIRRLGETRARVVRDGRARFVVGAELVPGDIVLLSGGNVVPADIRIVDMTSLQVSEAALTGESVPVEKQVEAVPEEAPLGERSSMLFKGTAVTRGDGAGVVIATGMDTEIGRITKLMMGADEAPTPMERQLHSLSGQLLWLTIILCTLIAVVGMLSGRETLLMIHAGIALAVAAIPEGLPIVATVALAGGMWRMARRNALVERMAAVETLGSTTVIFTDKTGTLTENRLVAAEACLASGRYKLPVRSGPSALRDLLETGVLCNHAILDGGGDSGDPLEIALLKAAAEYGIDTKAFRTGWPIESERPFDSSMKMMSTLHRRGNEVRIAVKGAPERLIERAGYALGEDGEAVENSPAVRDGWRSLAEDMAGSGLRVLALARQVGTRDDKLGLDKIDDLVLLGLVGFRDPPRSDVPSAIEACQKAGIRVIMVTGDHVATASAIAAQVGLKLPGAGAGAIDGATLDEQLALPAAQSDVDTANVFARVTPEHKLRLIERLRSAGEIVAMTGDGVNDAPALRQADIGIAMGQRGTDVAREAADMVLLDDSFPTIVTAISQGRVIFENIRRFVVYLLSCNLSEVLVVAMAIVLGLPMALLPLQILFLNLVTDVFPAFALAAGKGDPKVLERPPRPPAEPLIGVAQWSGIVRHGLTMTAVTLVALVVAVRGLELAPEIATTVSFLTIAFAQLFHVFNMRTAGAQPFDNDITRNPWVWAALGLCIVLLTSAVYIPPVAAALQLVPPTLSMWGLVVGLAMVPVVLGYAFERWQAYPTQVPPVHQFLR